MFAVLILIVPWVPLMNTFRSQDRRVRTARGVTWLSLLASTMSFASVIYVGPQAARESLGVDRSLEVVMPSPQTTWGQGTTEVRPTHRASSSSLESTASLIRVGGTAIGLRVDEVVDVSRVAPVAALLGGEVIEARRTVEPLVRRCSLAALAQGQQEVTLILHPVIGFLAQEPDVSEMTGWPHGRDSDRVGSGPVSCTSPDRLGKPSFAEAGPRLPVLAARQG